MPGPFTARVSGDGPPAGACAFRLVRYHSERLGERACADFIAEEGYGRGPTQTNHRKSRSALYLASFPKTRHKYAPTVTEPR